MRTGTLQVDERYGHLVIVGEKVEHSARGVPVIEVACDCGASLKVSTHRLRSGAERACPTCSRP